MPSFDVVSRVDGQELDNAINNTRKELAQRYDFRGIKTEIELDKKTKLLHIVTSDEMKMNALKDMLLAHCVKRKVDPKCLEFKDMLPGPRSDVKMDVLIKEGLVDDMAKKVVKLIKDSKLKVQAAIQGDEVRVSGKKIDDLQEVMALLRAGNLGIPLQFLNMKS